MIFMSLTWNKINAENGQVITKDMFDMIDANGENVTNAVTENQVKIGDLSGNGLTEADLATAIKNDRASLSDIKHLNVAYVETWGDDSTAVLGQIGKPFKTINAALDAMSIFGGYAIFLGIGIFVPMDKTKLKNNISIIGSGRPHYNSTNTALEGGTIIQGSFRILNKEYITVKDLGIDSGLDVCNNLYGGVAQEGLIVVTDDDGSHVLVTPKKGLILENIITLCKDASSPVHACLVEAVDGAEVHKIETRFGMHGIVLKALNSNGSNFRCHDHKNNGVIIKNSSYGKSGFINIDNILIDSSDVANGGLRIHNEFINNSQNSINVSNLQVKGTSYGVDFQADYQITGVQFNNVIITSTTNGITVSGTGGEIIRNAFNNLQILNVSGTGIASSINFKYNTFSNFRVVTYVGGIDGIQINGLLNSYSNGSVEGFVNALNCLDTNTTSQVLNNVLLLQNTNNAIGFISCLVVDGNMYNSIAPTLLNGWVNNGTTNLAHYTKTGGYIALGGLIKSGTTGTIIFTLPDGFKPTEDRRIPVVLQSGLGWLLIDKNGNVILESIITGSMGMFLCLDCCFKL
jgi:hypothetical protein